MTNNLGPWWGVLDLNQEAIKAPDLLSDFLAVSDLRPRHNFVPVRCVYQFRQPAHIFRTMKSFADLRHTLYNLQPYSISRETRSEHWVATPILPAPEAFQLPWHLHVVTHSMWDRRLMLLNPTQEWLPTTFTRHSELLNNFLLSTKPNSNFFLLVIAIGLLAPRPYLIARLLWHQRGLPYWSTLVWNSHQLIPNKAYSPTGASIAEAIRRYFWLRLSLHFCPSRPPVRERPANLTIYGSTYCRLSSTKLLFGLLAPSGRIRISARWYSFFTEVQNFSRFNDSC